VEWSDEPKQMIRNALKTVDISKVIIEERADERRNVKVVVPDEQYTMAIGRNGQNVRLAAKLTGWKIYIYSETEYHKELEEKREQYTNILKNFDGMNEEILGAMYDAGIFDLEEIAELTAEGFAEEVEGVDIDMAASFINAARTALEELKQEAQAGPETAASESEALEEETDSPEEELQESEDADNPEEGTEEPENEAEQEEEDPSEKPEA
jgi:N utilization substance protein A